MIGDEIMGKEIEELKKENIKTKNDFRDYVLEQKVEWEKMKRYMQQQPQEKSK